MSQAPLLLNELAVKDEFRRVTKPSFFFFFPEYKLPSNRGCVLIKHSLIYRGRNDWLVCKHKENLYHFDLPYDAYCIIHQIFWYITVNHSNSLTVTSCPIKQYFAVHLQKFFLHSTTATITTATTITNNYSKNQVLCHLICIDK